LSDDPAYLSAAAALAAFKARKLSPVEVLKAQVARAERFNPKLIALGDTYFDEALAAAHMAEDRYARSDGRPRPLEGIAVAIKDEMQIAGKRATQGSLTLVDNVAKETDVAVERLIDAGAIIHARTVTPEFCLIGVTHSRLWGVSRNPYDLDCNPGGSSGGSASALAAGFTTLALGSDIGGSIRIPSSACGTVGYLPPHGRVPDAPPYNLDWSSRTGPMARAVGDCALMLNVISGFSPRDLVSIREAVAIPPHHDSIGGWKIAYSLDFGYKTLDADVRANTLKAIEAFRDLGASCEEVAIPWDKSLEALRRDYLYVLWGKRMWPMLARRRDELCPYTVKYIEAAFETPLDALHRGIDAITAIYALWSPMMERYNVFVCPTLAIPAAKAEHDAFDASFTIDGVPADPRSGWIMTYPFNLLGRVPVLAVPSGRARNGVPTGIQICGRAYDDLSVFRAAANFEKAVTFSPPEL
jgi:amidase